MSLCGWQDTARTKEESAMQEDESNGGLEAMLMDRTLSDPELLELSGRAPDYRILPDVSVLKIGGHSVIDRGRAAVYAIVDELAVLKHSHPLLIGTGAGTRARHAYALATDLGLPTGVLTDIGAAV